MSRDDAPNFRSIDRITCIGCKNCKWEPYPAGVHYSYFMCLKYDFKINFPVAAVCNDWEDIE